MFSEPRFLVERKLIRSVSPEEIEELVGGGDTLLHTHLHNLMSGLDGGTEGTIFEVGVFEPTAFEEGSLQYYHLSQGEYLGTEQSAINAAKLLGKNWEAPDPIGSLTPAAVTATILTATEGLVNPAGSGEGIKVDPADPTFGWRDLLGPIETKIIGATDPIWSAYRGSIYAYTFDAATSECFITFHIPHDYVPGSDLYIHMHWSQNVVDTGGLAGVPGNIEWKFDITYADGHGTPGGAADPFIAPITVTVVQQGPTTQYGHMIAEVQFTNNGGTGGLIDSNTIQVDGLLLVRAYRTKANPADTLNQAPFGHTCDIHYQSTNQATKNKSPNFYV